MPSSGPSPGVPGTVRLAPATALICAWAGPGDGGTTCCFSSWSELDSRIWRKLTASMPFEAVGTIYRQERTLSVIQPNARRYDEEEQRKNIVGENTECVDHNRPWQTPIGLLALNVVLVAPRTVYGQSPLKFPQSTQRHCDEAFLQDTLSLIEARSPPPPGRPNDATKPIAGNSPPTERK